MKKPIKKKKRLDIAELAKGIVDAATDNEPPVDPKPEESAASQFARKGGLKGGKARAAKMTKEQRSEAARKAALARWKKATTNKP